MEDVITVMFVCAVILAGFYIGQLWISIIFAVVLLALLFAPGSEERQAVPRGPAVRPIIVKRKYVGPESIYPKDMKIKISDKEWGSGYPWFIWAPKVLGGGFGKMFRGLFGVKKKEEK